MARDLARYLAPGGVAILAGLLRVQARDVLAAHRRNGLLLDRMIHLEPWTTLVLRKPARDPQARLFKQPALGQNIPAAGTQPAKGDCP
jgi:hypothetical protein